MATGVLNKPSRLWTTLMRSPRLQSPTVRRWMHTAVVLVALRYHWWRITQTLVFDLSAAAILVDAFWFLELFMTYQLLRGCRACLTTSDRTPEVEANLRWYGSASSAPLIDILIVTYNENLAILRMTILAATHQDYSRYRVWVLDDGCRAWLADLCAELGVHYVAREERAHFKAGNLNHGLERVLAQSERPDYVAVLDADCITYPAFLERTLALMHEPRVGLVQTPQYFYNPDPFQYAFDAHAAWPDWWRSLDVVYTSMDARGGAGCLGTAFLVRMEALQAVKGIPTGALLENGLLAKRLARLGWRRVFLKERLSVGRNVESLADLQHQHQHWYVGEMQILQLDRQAMGPRAPWRSKLAWFRNILIWLADPAVWLVWMVVPTVYWLTGVSLVRATTEDALSYCLPMLLAPHALVVWLSRGALMPFCSHVEPLLLAPGRVAAGLSVLFRPGDPRRFASEFVTPKAVQANGMRIHWRTLTWTGSLFLALLGSLIYRSRMPWPDPSAQAFWVWNAAATSIAGLLLWIMIIPCFERPRYRFAERYAGRGRIRVRREGSATEGTLHDLSLTGARISLPSAPPLGARLSIALSSHLELPAHVVRITPSGQVGLQLSPASDQEMELIRLVLFSRTYVPQADHWSWWGFCIAVIRRMTGIRAAS